ncbi:hypothetical protein [Segniliparus rugosus]|nr:hypothetical protein [Segniliparus rugosus]
MSIFVAITAATVCGVALTHLTVFAERGPQPLVLISTMLPLFLGMCGFIAYRWATFDPTAPARRMDGWIDN